MTLELAKQRDFFMLKNKNCVFLAASSFEKYNSSFKNPSEGGKNSGFLHVNDILE